MIDNFFNLDSWSLGVSLSRLFNSYLIFAGQPSGIWIIDTFFQIDNVVVSALKTQIKITSLEVNSLLHWV